MKQNKIPEIVCFIIFIICTVFISFFHEPWLDEFQAWAISKETIYDILFVIPHSEAHPPLWHLVLKCFSFFNVNPEAGLSIANFIFIYPAIWLLIFQSPFNRIIRLTLPFTYFIFYQYAIISRPYSIFILGIFLAALFYKERNIKPFKFISALILVSFSSAYGMFFTAGIAIVWFIEMVKNTNFNTLKRDKRIYSLVLLFFVLLLLSIIIFPYKDVQKTSFSGYFSLKFLFSFFIMPIDTLVTNICHHVPSFEKVNILWCLLTIFVYVIFYKILKFYKALLLFFIPFFIFLTVVFSLYISSHHIGLLTLFYIFVFWCIFSEKQQLLPLNVKKFYSIILFFTISIQIYWSIFAYIADYKYDYDISRSASNYIKKYNLYNYKMMTIYQIEKNYVNKYQNKIIPYNIKIPENQKEQFFKNYYLQKKIQYNKQPRAVIIIPYFNKNIFYSFNMDNPQQQYINWKPLTKEQNEILENKLINCGLPEIILFPPNYLQDIFPEDKLKDIYYIKLFEMKTHFIWKNNLKSGKFLIYAREDIYNELKLNYPDIDIEN